MAETPIETTLADVDIQAAIDRLVTHYPPLVQDRHQLDFEVDKGKVVARGWVRTTITRRYLVDGLTALAGVVAVNSDQLYSDDDLRLQIGRLVPVGVFANMGYGAIVLTGDLPKGTTAAKLSAAIGKVKGVRAVYTDFSA